MRRKSDSERELRRILGKRIPASPPVEAGLEAAFAQIREGARPAVRRRAPVWKTAVILAAAAAACAGAVYAAVGIYRFAVERQGYSLAVTLPQSGDEYVRFGTVSLPGYTLARGDESVSVLKYTSNEGREAGKDLLLQLYRVDRDLRLDSLFTDVAAWEETETDGLQILTARQNGVVSTAYARMTDYGQRALALDKESGYFVCAYAMNGLSREELVSLLSKVTLVPCSEEEAPVYLLASDLQDAASGSQPDERTYRDGQIASPGETVAFEDAQFTLEEVEVLDSLSSLVWKPAAFREDAQRSLPDVAGEDGSILPYDRETVRVGDGVETPANTVAEVRVTSPRLVLLTVRVKNTAAEPREICVNNALVLLRQDGDVWTERQTSYRRPTAYDSLMTDGRAFAFRESDGGKGSFFKTLQAGEEAEYRLAYLVDDDLLADAAYCLSMNASEVMPQDCCIRLFGE